jgi:hypothetical protein
MMSQAAILKAIYKRFAEPYLKLYEDPVGAQEKTLQNILKRNEGTVYGKDHNFTNIKSVDEYQRSVPLVNYDLMQPYIARTMQGEQNILFPEPIACFLMTSGTTGNPKLYPFGEYRVEETMLMLIRGAAIFVVHNNRFDILEGKRLTFPAPALTGQKVGNYDVAFFSGALTVAPIPPQLSKFSFEPRRVPPKEVDNELDWNKKFYLAARYAVAADVRSAVGVTSNLISLLRKISTGFLDRLLSDSELDSTIKGRLREAAHDSIINLRELWPNFRVIFHSGVSITPFRRIIQDLLGDIDLWEGYMATEATLGGQLYIDKGMMPILDKIFFEFISDEKDAKPIPLSDVKVGIPYKVVITTFGGFYRYDIGDVVEFTGISPYTFRVIGRRNSIVNLAGERMSEELFLRTLERACKRFDIGFIDFALLPEVTADIFRYKIYVEFTQLPDDLDEFTAFVDERLGLANMIYAAQRQANVLSSPILIPVKPGGFEIMLQKREKVLGQTKVPRLLTSEISRMIPILNHGS